MKNIAAAIVTILILVAAPQSEAAGWQKKGECGFKVVSYRVTGNGGQTFVYAGRSFTIPAHGSLEILATKQDRSMNVSSRTLDLTAHQPDPMGVVTVALERLDLTQPTRAIAGR